MTWEWWVTTVLAGIAAIGVVLNEFRHHMSRPLIDVRVRAVKKNPFPEMRAFGEGEWLMEIRNFGTVDALDIQCVGIGMQTFGIESGPPIGNLPPGESVRFSATPTQGTGVEGVWLLLTYMTSSMPHGKCEMSWWPAAEGGELAAVRRRQLKRSLWKRWLARSAFRGHAPSPLTLPKTRRTALSQEALTYEPPSEAAAQGKMWRVRLATRLLREPVPEGMATELHI